jgi:hypothetical protein
MERSPGFRHRGRLTAFACALLLLATLSACLKREVLDDLDPYRGAWLLPLINSHGTLQQVAELERLRLHAEIAPDSVDLPPGDYPAVPAVSLPLIGPVPIPVAEYLEEVRAEIAELRMDLMNGLPIAIGAGTRLELRNAPDPANGANLLFEAALDGAVQPGGTWSTSITNSLVSIGDTIFLYLRDASSPGGTDVTVTGDERLSFSITIDLRRVDYVRVRPDHSFGGRDSFALSLAPQLDGNTDVAQGWLVVYADNGLPVQGELQLYLYDGAGALADSLFDEPFALNGGTTDPQGSTTLIGSTSDSIAIDATRMQRWLDVRSAALAFRINTNGYPSPWVQATGESLLRLQLVGDLRLNIAYTRLQ